MNPGLPVSIQSTLLWLRGRKDPSEAFWPFHFEKEENIPFSLSPSTLGVHQDQQGVGTWGGDDLVLKR